MVTLVATKPRRTRKTEYSSGACMPCSANMREEVPRNAD